MKILADATLPELDTAFPPPFEITRYFRQEDIKQLIKDQDILLCRSTLQVNQHVVEKSNLRFVATASSGTDHIDETELQKLSIQLVDAKGCNAFSVADYVLSCFAYLVQYKQFKAKKIGIIGMGYVGQVVAHYFHELSFEVMCYDPLKALLEPNFMSCSLQELLTCDLICIHANLHNDEPFPSNNLLTFRELTELNENTAIINAARGNILCETDLLRIKKPIFYCADVFLNEPDINSNLIEFATLCTPHIAGHSIEAKQRAVTLLSEKLHAYYQLTPPLFKTSVAKKGFDFGFQDNWPETILSRYNPVFESETLKQALNKSQAFLTLRKQHNFRHDFNFC